LVFNVQRAIFQLYSGRPIYLDISIDSNRWPWKEYLTLIRCFFRVTDRTLHLSGRKAIYHFLYNHLTLLTQLYVRLSILLICGKQTLENTEGAVKNGQSREICNTGYTRRRKTKHNTLCVRHHHTQAYTNNGRKTPTLPQTTGGKDEPRIARMRKS
jgi:hypothetical protein